MQKKTKKIATNRTDLEDGSTVGRPPGVQEVILAGGDKPFTTGGKP